MRKVISLMMVLVLGVAVMGTSAMAEADLPLVIQVPFSRSDLCSEVFRPQGDRFLVSWRDGDRFRCSVVDALDGSVHTITVYPAAQLPAVLKVGERLYMGFGDPVEGGIVNSIYDYEGNVRHSRLGTTWLRPTPSGSYLIAASSLLRSTSFGVFDSQLKPLVQPSAPLVDSRSWDAVPISDSMCLVRSGRTVKQVSLPGMLVQCSREVPINPGVGILGLYCNTSGTTCAVTNYSDITVLDMADGSIFEFSGKHFNSALISHIGDRVFLLRDRGDGLLTISQHCLDQALSKTSIEVDLHSCEPGFIRSYFDTAYFTNSHIVINYTVMKSWAGRNSSLMKSLLIAQPFSADSELAFVDGPSWPADPSASKAYSLEFLGENRLSVSRLGIEEGKE